MGNYRIGDLQKWRDECIHCGRQVCSAQKENLNPGEAQRNAETEGLEVTVLKQKLVLALI